MPEPFPPLDVPALYEYKFQSSTPFIGPLIVRVRRVLYSLTAKWPLRVALDQQTRINRQLADRLLEHEARFLQDETLLRNYEALLRDYEARLLEYEARLIDQDRDLAHLARLTAEVDLRQRSPLKMQPHSESDD